MPWVKIDDRFWSNRKVRKAGQSIGAYVLCLSWCSDQLTDGYIPVDELDFICSGLKNPSKDMGHLVVVGLLAASDDGWIIPDYLEFNPSREEVERKRESDRARKANGGRKDSARSPDGTEPEAARSSEVPSRPVPSPTDNPPNPPAPQGGTTTAEADQPLELHCPRASCDQPPGQPCIDRSGSTRAPHSIRCTDRIFARIVAQDSSPLTAADAPNGTAACDCDECDGLGFVFTAEDLVDFCPNRNRKGIPA